MSSVNVKRDAGQVVAGNVRSVKKEASQVVKGNAIFRGPVHFHGAHVSHAQHMPAMPATAAQALRRSHLALKALECLVAQHGAESTEPLPVRRTEFASLLGIVNDEQGRCLDVLAASAGTASAD